MQEGTAEDIKKVLVILKTPLLPGRHVWSLRKTVHSAISGTEHDGGLKSQGHKDSKKAPRCKVTTAKQASTPASAVAVY